MSSSIDSKYTFAQYEQMLYRQICIDVNRKIELHNIERILIENSDMLFAPEWWCRESHLEHCMILGSVGYASPLLQSARSISSHPPSLLLKTWKGQHISQHATSKWSISQSEHDRTLNASLWRLCSQCLQRVSIHVHYMSIHASSN